MVSGACTGILNGLPLQSWIISWVASRSASACISMKLVIGLLSMII